MLNPDAWSWCLILMLDPDAWSWCLILMLDPDPWSWYLILILDPVGKPTRWHDDKLTRSQDYNLLHIKSISNLKLWINHWLTHWLTRVKSRDASASKKEKEKHQIWIDYEQPPLSPSLCLQLSWTQVEFAAREMEHIIRSAPGLIWSAGTIASSCWTTGLQGSVQEGKESHRGLWEAEQWGRRGLSNSRSIVEAVRFFTAFLVTFHHYLSNLENFRSSHGVGGDH